MEAAPSFVPFTGRTGPFAPFLPGLANTFEPISGHGSPEGVVPAAPPQSYTDLDTDNLWLKLAGTQALGWYLVGVTGTSGSGGGGGGTGGVSNLFRSDVDPNGVQNCTGAGIVLGDGVMAGKIWVKGTSGTSNSEWGLLIG